MNDVAHHTPAGAPILGCDSDESCSLVACEICIEELPLSALASDEVADYVQHFFGLECLELWRARSGNGQTGTLGSAEPDLPKSGG